MQPRKYRRRTPDVTGAPLDPRGFAAALAMKRGFVVLEEGVAIPLKRGRGRTVATDFVWVSYEDRHFGLYYWSPTPWQYPRRRDKNGGCIFLHREIMGLSEGDGLVIDHVNRDRYDCRRENLRVVTQAENCQNQGSRRNATSGHRGVSYNSEAKKWVVMHTLKGKARYGGTFATEEEAAVAALAWRSEHMPYAGDSSKYRGVSWAKAAGQWHAQGKVNYKTVHIGYFESEVEAAAAAEAWRREHMPFSTD